MTRARPLRTPSPAVLVDVLHERANVRVNLGPGQSAEGRCPLIIDLRAFTRRTPAIRVGTTPRSCAQSPMFSAYLRSQVCVSIPPSLLRKALEIQGFLFSGVARITLPPRFSSQVVDGMAPIAARQPQRIAFAYDRAHFCIHLQRGWASSLDISHRGRGTSPLAWTAMLGHRAAVGFRPRTTRCLAARRACSRDTVVARGRTTCMGR